ncbi:hypothetical protein THAR02_04178 [Trichoderma harzianum]|uniref:Uncharacterized protein n=1 Tax=Trichoderma harzianum TaxID=5544 RepID=A0A0F9XF92_TRIHA|nr:hypothetical protein THAR02_04178 [Trichoderma harzianum]
MEAEWAPLHKTQQWFDMSRYQMHITVARGGFSCGERDREIELASLPILLRLPMGLAVEGDAALLPRPTPTPSNFALVRPHPHLFFKPAACEKHQRSKYRGRPTCIMGPGPALQGLLTHGDHFVRQKRPRPAIVIRINRRHVELRK